MSNLVIYCLHCAVPNYYTLNKPNFCSGCGKSFNSTVAAATNITQKQERVIHSPRQIKQIVPKILPKEVDLEYEDGEENITSVPDVSQSEVFEIQGSKNSGITIGDIAVGKKREKVKGEIKGKKIKFDKESFLKSYSEQGKGLAARDTSIVPEE